jgi:hypothetical protein
LPLFFSPTSNRLRLSEQALINNLFGYLLKSQNHCRILMTE